MSKSNAPTFFDYVSRFEEPDFPLVLHAELHLEFSTRIEPFRSNMIQMFIIDGAGIEEDELTEFIPLFRWEVHEDVVVLLLWRASLLSYEYYLMTYDKSGNLNDKQVIAGQKSDGAKIISRVATIEDESNIVMLEGESSEDNHALIEGTVKEFDFEITPSGYIFKG